MQRHFVARHSFTAIQALFLIVIRLLRRHDILLSLRVCFFNKLVEHDLLIGKWLRKTAIVWVQLRLSTLTVVNLDEARGLVYNRFGELLPLTSFVDVSQSIEVEKRDHGFRLNSWGDWYGLTIVEVRNNLVEWRFNFFFDNRPNFIFIESMFLEQSLNFFIICIVDPGLKLTTKRSSSLLKAIAILITL